MSIPVPLDELEQQLAGYGVAYLLTVGESHRPHAVAVRPMLAGGRLSVPGPGRRTTANVLARPDVTVLWPPVEPGGYTLILDGHADASAVDPQSGGGDLQVRPSHAVLHRPADRAEAGTTPATGSECGNDCVPLG